MAKGVITAWPATGATCAAPSTANGFTLTNVYLRGAADNQDTELDGSGNWVHTNVYGEGGLTATYWQPPPPTVSAPPCAGIRQVVPIAIMIPGPEPVWDISLESGAQLIISDWVNSYPTTDAKLGVSCRRLSHIGI